MKSITKCVSAISVLTIAIIPASSAMAQAPSSSGPAEAADANSLGDIVVTARRRSESLQRVPVAVTAQTGLQLERSGIHDLMDLNRSTPSLSISASSRGSNVPNVVIRGQRQIDTGINTDPAVVLYENELPFVRPNGLNGSFYDIESVQVLRGPQGTLFGRNTTGGALLITTNRPTDKVQGRIAGSVGNFAFWDGEAMLNLPIGEGIALRVAGKITRRDGYMHDRVSGREANNVKNDGERATLRIDRGIVTSDFMYERFFGTNNGTFNQIFGVVGPFAASLSAEVAANRSNPYTYVNNTPGEETSKAETFGNITTLRLADEISLKNIIGWRNVSSFSRQDFDGSSAFLLSNDGVTHVRQFSNELQLSGKSGNLDWVGGIVLFQRAW
ncbi:TonB-dependent receptor plug domain-containing protein [Novosphingobium sp. G106]|uniref:TonB-dependent receptor plug domain-containing protein n=1 Tax=Novosphingobium sp. G106 TaxID=2849500 RepID=UPI001C2D7EAD|nr:TonB-dependent receptor plug domain-containing protein [Novosphingobium sp. G106]MBV1688862.1 TonB-dependent receptor plug domain-containing protein [Novosphingobium sp. G106]